MKSLSIRLDDMASEITRLLEWFEQPQVIVHGGSTHSMANLQVCVSSAKRFVSAAIRIISIRLADSDSRRSEHADLTDQRRSEINFWLRKHAGSDAIEETTQLGSASSVITASTFDREHANLQSLLKFSREAYIAQKFDEARLLLQTFRKRSEIKYGLNFDERNEVLGMLATIYCRLADWKHAEEIVHMSFDGQESAVRSLVFSYWDHCRWDDAERILLGISESDTVHETDCEYILAELYLVRGYHDKAIQSCDRLLRLLAKDNVLFYLTLNLLTQVYEAKGDVFEARLHRDLLPPGIERLSLLAKSTNQKCVMASISCPGCGRIKQPWRHNLCG
jgi:tetratricopeptide (TPR) repeat protein